MLSVYYVIFSLLPLCAFGLPARRSQPVGGVPTELQSAPYHLISELGDSASL